MYFEKNQIALIVRSSQRTMKAKNIKQVDVVDISVLEKKMWMVWWKYLSLSNTLIRKNIL